MFLFCIVFVQKMPNTYQIFWEMFKLLKKCNLFCVCFLVLLIVHLKKMIKTDVLYLVSQFLRTRRNNFYILK